MKETAFLKRVLTLDGHSLTVASLAQAARNRTNVELSTEARAAIKRARNLVDDAIENDKAVYGVTTGLGARANERLTTEQLTDFSYKTLRGRAHAIGQPSPDDIVRASMIVRLNTFAHGAAAVSPEVAEYVTHIINRNLIPIVGETASIGASDLVWNATLGLAFIGEGKIRNSDGVVKFASEALAAADLEPLKIGPRDGLALTNHSSYSAAISSIALYDATIAFEALQTAAALSMEGFRANLSPFDQRVLKLRPQPGQEQAANGIRKRLAGSALSQTGAARRLQDPLSIRNIPQIHGALIAAIGFAKQACEIEINGASDNPVALVDEGEIVSAGAYHTPHLTNVVETVSRAFVQTATTQVARMSKMLSGRFTDLPQFLASPGQDSNGFAPVMKTAEAFLGELIHAASPVPIWPSLNADGVEDSLTHTPLAAKALMRIVESAQTLTAIELMISSQAVELRGLETNELSQFTLTTLTKVRKLAKSLATDRPLGSEIGLLNDAVKSATFSPS